MPEFHSSEVGSKDCQAELAQLQPGGAKLPVSRSDTERFTKRDWLLAILVFVLALAVRGVYLYHSDASPTYNAPVVDAGTYHTIAAKLAVGHHWDEGFFWQPFFYPFFLSWIYYLAGPSLVIAKLVQIVLGSATASMTFLLGRMLLGRKIGLAAGVMAVFYGPLVFVEADLMGDWMLAFWSPVLLLAMLKAQRKRTWRSFLLLGPVAGLGLLMRPTIVPFLFVGGAYLVWKGICAAGSWRRAGLAVVVGLAGFAAVTLPVAALNKHITGHFAMLPFSGGINLYIGNNEDTDRTITIRPGNDWYLLNTWPRRSGVGRDMKSQRDFFYSRVREYVESDPLSFLAGLGSKTVRFFSSREIPRNIDIYMFRQWSPLLGVLAWKAGPWGFPFGVVLPLAAVGLVCTWRRMPAVAKLFMLLYPAAVILFFVADRYRLPIMPVTLILAAGGGAAVIEMLLRRRWRRLGLSAFAMAAVVVFATIPGPFVEEEINLPAELNFNLGVFYQRDGNDLDKSAQFFTRAIELRGNYADAWNELGITESLRLRSQAACDAFLRAIAINPSLVRAMYNLSIEKYQQGNLEASMAILDRAIAVEPRDGQLYYRMGLALAGQGRERQAMESYKRALELAEGGDDENVYLIRSGMGDALLAGAQDSSAASEYVAALRLSDGWKIKINRWAVLRNLAWLRATSRDETVRNAEQAVALADEAIKTAESEGKTRVLPSCLSVLAAAYAESGRFEEAVSTAEEAMMKASAVGKTKLAERIRLHLESYRAGRSYRPTGPELPW